MKDKLAPFVENIGEAGAACLMMMVQGNLVALTPAHWLIATQTGIVAGSITAGASLLAGVRRRWAVSAVLGVVTATVDFLVHPGTTLSIAGEAVVTGLGAAALSLLVGAMLHAVRRRSAI